MPAICQWPHRFAVCWALLVAFAISGPSFAQNISGIEPNIKATLVADGPAVPGENVTLAIHFEPVSDEWHGYWANPGDAGYGMQLEWDLPAGWTAGEPQYPVPQKLLISNLMNHIYEGSYAVLVSVSVPSEAQAMGAARIGLKAQWLACTDKICVPEEGEMELTLPLGDRAFGDGRFAEWQAAIPPMIDSAATFEMSGNTLRIAIPLPSVVNLADPHIYIANTDLVQYAALQTYMRSDDLLVAEIALSDPDTKPEQITGILAFDGKNGVRFAAKAGDIAPIDGAFTRLSSDTPAVGLLLLAALAGGLILNIMPCVFPILSLKALSLARAGGSESKARKEGIAYTVGVILACVALGAIMLALRAAGEQIGWAFQLQEPGVVVALLVLAVAITANLAGVFELPSVSLTRSGEPASAFATGLLAAVAATPCTGPFMAAAMGAALLLPAYQALLLFAVLGLGLALPFLLIGLVPALRNRLPKPGTWMERFRRLMAIPMGLTALALVWLVSRLGGQGFALMAMVLIIGLFIALAVVGRLQSAGKMAWPAFGLIIAPFAIFAAFALPASYSESVTNRSDSLLNPVEYSAVAMVEARASGRPVFAWFTADWCVTCKVNESVAIEREATRAAFAKAGVVAIRGDWTRRDAAITEYLTEHGAAGVPLYVWYPAGGEAQILPQVLTPDSLVTLAKGSLEPDADRPLPTAQGAGSD
ncbi:protein-disulfide reductase DsbD family protein [Pontixanthobacter aestiaquae]|uniref:Thiol:disulfide interchange protein n=1 Tax=Pontixanthobacter aestiaquae TaxID=1509367 RepID=A0A844Z8B9_9SPHN|nr:protein-disulfide reductase DsbD [Pontixanthobacter aestiaquae]MDN3644832.1 protein-disulfide reductase DsbD family protein [Pontixanthobacter aestiaquae]MXO84165.1 thiol:disulfide interchange protein [Pontixanthobacter aestiaquae]